MISSWQFFKKIVAASNLSYFGESVWSLWQILSIVGFQRNFIYYAMLKEYNSRPKKDNSKNYLKVSYSRRA